MGPSFVVGRKQGGRMLDGLVQGILFGQSTDTVNRFFRLLD